MTQYNYRPKKPDNNSFREKVSEKRSPVREVKEKPGIGRLPTEIELKVAEYSAEDLQQPENRDQFVKAIVNGTRQGKRLIANYVETFGPQEGLAQEPPKPESSFFSR